MLLICVDKGKWNILWTWLNLPKDFTSDTLYETKKCIKIKDSLNSSCLCCSLFLYVYYYWLINRKLSMTFIPHFYLNSWVTWILDLCHINTNIRCCKLNALCVFTALNFCEMSSILKLDRAIFLQRHGKLLLSIHIGLYIYL